jgi:sugar/nucleoside kinase (ribokinase family)
MKMGVEGALAQRGHERFSSPAFKVDPVDSVGAGDSFDAGSLSQYVRGADLPLFGRRQFGWCILDNTSRRN